MLIVEDLLIKTDLERLNFSDGTETPDTIEDSKIITTPGNQSVSGVLALCMLGVAVIIIVFGLWAQKHRRKPMLMQYGTNMKSYQAVCIIPAKLQLPQFMTQIKNDIENVSQLNCSDKYVPLVHDKRKPLLQKAHIYHKRHNKILTVSDLWKEKSKRTNNFCVINVIPEEDGD